MVCRHLFEKRSYMLTGRQRLSHEPCSRMSYVPFAKTESSTTTKNIKSVPTPFPTGGNALHSPSPIMNIVMERSKLHKTILQPDEGL